MLNEFYDIAKSLKAAGIRTVPLDKRIKGPSAGEKICIELAANSEIDGLRLITAETIKKSWTIANGNKNSFPFIRLQASLLQHDYGNDELKKLKKDIFKRGAAITEAIELLESDANRFDRRVIEISDWDSYRKKIELRKSKLDSIAGEMQIVPLTHTRFLDLSNDFKSMTEQLVDALLAALKRPSEELAKIVFSLFYEGAVQVCFEASLDDGEFSIISPALKLPISECLSDGEDTNSKDQAEGKANCAVSNLPGQLNKGAFPKPKLPLLGPTSLYARKSDVHCRHRYGQRGVDSIGIGEETISQMHAGIVAICNEDNEGKTWTKIPSENPSNRDLLVVYVESGLDIPIAAALDEDSQFQDSQSELDEAAFVQKTRAVTAAIKGNQLANKKEARLRLLIIRKVDTCLLYTSPSPRDS